MNCPNLVPRFALAALLLAACGDDGGRGSTGTGPTTSPGTATDSTTNGTQSASGSEDTSTGTASTVDPDTETEPTTDPTTAPTTGPTTDPTASTDSSDSGEGPPLCSYSCAGKADCTVNGNDIGLACLDGECVPGCASDDPCVAFHSGWTLTPCTASGECDTDVCVVFEGGSGCAITPAVGACTGFGMVEGQRMDTEGNTVTVCTQPTATCIDIDGTQQCHVPCTPTSCGARTCGADGFCGCDDFVACYTDQVGDYCTAQGRCEFACSSPADCPATNVDGDQPVCG